jgi:hypothetical protein
MYILLPEERILKKYLDAKGIPEQFPHINVRCANLFTVRN